MGRAPTRMDPGRPPGHHHPYTRLSEQFRQVPDTIIEGAALELRRGGGQFSLGKTLSNRLFFSGSQRFSLRAGVSVLLFWHSSSSCRAENTPIDRGDGFVWSADPGLTAVCNVLGPRWGLSGLYSEGLRKRLGPGLRRGLCRTEEDWGCHTRAGVFYDTQPRRKESKWPMIKSPDVP